jgi:hypothetical protein
VYSFGTISGGTGSGFSSRQGKSFSYSVPAPASFLLNFSADATTIDVQFINEESPGIWRVSVHATGPSSQQFFVGLFMMKSAEAFSGFSTANVSGNSFHTSVDEEICGGPYALLSVLDSNSFCRPPYFGWIFGASNTVNRLQNGASWGVWQLPGGANSGRLLFANPSFVASPIQQERGWELARSDAGYTDMWVLENVTVNPQPANTGAPPVVFRPTGRLSHVTKQP